SKVRTGGPERDLSEYSAPFRKPIEIEGKFLNSESRLPSMVSSPLSCSLISARAWLTNLSCWVESTTNTTPASKVDPTATMIRGRITHFFRKGRMVRCDLAGLILTFAYKYRIRNANVRPFRSIPDQNFCFCPK